MFGFVLNGRVSCFFGGGGGEEGWGGCFVLFFE